MNHESRCVEQTIRSTIDDLAGMVDLNQIGSLDQRESSAEWIHPECRRVNWVA
jgi:hypothetical protein